MIYIYLFVSGYKIIFLSLKGGDKNYVKKDQILLKMTFYSFDTLQKK